MKDEKIREGTLYRIHDGDTFNAVVNLGLGVQIDVPIRIAHVDTPELNTPEGLVTKTRLMEFLGMKSDFDKVNVTMKFLKKEKYGRWLCEVSFKDQDLTQFIVKEGLGIPYEGTKKIKQG